jgi:glycosyltransferase involved in cell wall biosynthesis
VVTTEREARMVREIWAGARVHVIPNGVDASYFNPGQLSAAANSKDALQPTVAFVGDMSYFPNQEAASFFARSVLPLIRLELSDARFLIVGRNPSRRVRELQQIAGVEVTGSVPDVRPYLAQTHVSVAPFSIAAGIQNKILEAMACGVPVVATTRSAQGLAPEVVAALETAEGADELASKVLRLLKDPQLARRKGMEGMRQVTAGHNWERSLEMLLQLLENPKRREPSRAMVQNSPA